MHDSLSVALRSINNHNFQALVEACRAIREVAVIKEKKYFSDDDNMVLSRETIYQLDDTSIVVNEDDGRTNIKLMHFKSVLAEAEKGW